MKPSGPVRRRGREEVGKSLEASDGEGTTRESVADFAEASIGPGDLDPLDGLMVCQSKVGFWQSTAAVAGPSGGDRPLHVAASSLDRDLGADSVGVGRGLIPELYAEP